jgi:hypothetical protein
MPGRSRTGSSPLRTLIEDSLYELLAIVNRLEACSQFRVIHKFRGQIAAKNRKTQSAQGLGWADEKMCVQPQKIMLAKSNTMFGRKYAANTIAESISVIAARTQRRTSDSGNHDKLP